VIASAESVEVAAPEIVQSLLEVLGADLGGLWFLHPGREELQPFVIRSSSAWPGVQAFIECSRQLGFAQGNGLPGRVWQERRALSLKGVAEESHPERRRLGAAAGFKSAIAFPIQSGAEFFGVFEFWTGEPVEDDSDLLNMMTAIGSEIGQF